MGNFLFVIILIYIIYREVKILDSQDNNQHKRISQNQYINAYIAPIVLIIRFGNNITSEKKSAINFFIKSRVFPELFPHSSLQYEAAVLFTRYSTLYKDDLKKCVQDAGDTIIKMNFNREDREFLLMTFFDICDFLGEINPIQRSFIESFARKINLNAHDVYDKYIHLKNNNNDYYNQNSNYNNNSNSNYNNYEQYRQNNNSNDELEKAYKTLGLTPDATEEEIKSKKNKLLRKWHPDLYAQQGEEAIKKATQNSQRINEAYDIIKEYRGFN